MQPFVVACDIWLHIVTHEWVANNKIFSSVNRLKLQKL